MNPAPTSLAQVSNCSAFSAVPWGRPSSRHRRAAMPLVDVVAHLWWPKNASAEWVSVMKMLSRLLPETPDQLGPRAAWQLIPLLEDQLASGHVGAHRVALAVAALEQGQGEGIADRALDDPLQRP